MTTEENIREADELVDGGDARSAVRYLIDAVKLLSAQIIQIETDCAQETATAGRIIAELQERQEAFNSSLRDLPGAVAQTIDDLGKRIITKIDRIINLGAQLEEENKLIKATLAIQNATIKLQSERIGRIEEREGEPFCDGPEKL